jgi:two-component system response regulator HydG
MEREMILRTLEETGGNRTRSAKILGISRRTLQLKLKDYGIN